MRPLVVLDTSVLIFLLTEKTNDTQEEQDHDLRRQACKQVISELSTQFRFAIPTAVVAELGAHGPSHAVLRQIATELGRFRLLPLTRGAATIAANIAMDALKARGLGKERGAVKYDALIIGTAVDAMAVKIVTENSRDFPKMLKGIGATSIEILVPSGPPSKSGQQGHLYQLPSKPKK